MYPTTRSAYVIIRQDLGATKLHYLRAILSYSAQNMESICSLMQNYKGLWQFSMLHFLYEKLIPNLTHAGGNAVFWPPDSFLFL